MHGFGGMGFGMGWWWIIGLILVAALIWTVIRPPGQNNNLNNTANHKSPLDILKERYARGEIDKEDFEQRKKDLS
jgi:putative membrane protein